MSPVIPVVAVVMIFLFGRKKKRKSKIPECPPFPWLEDDVDAAFSAGVNEGLCEQDALVRFVLKAVYPVTPEGEPIDWDSAARNLATECLEQRTHIRVKALLSQLEDDVCPPPNGGEPKIIFGTAKKKPADVIGPYISPTPKPNSFYRIKSGDNLSTVARKTLGLNAGHPLVVPIIQCITSDAWNLTYFGASPWNRSKPCGTRKSKKTPTYTQVDTPAGKQDILQAFCPKHQDHIVEMFAGRLPDRTIDANGDKTTAHKKYGVVWIPDLRKEGNAIACPDEDGPPQEVLSVLK